MEVLYELDLVKQSEEVGGARESTLRQLQLSSLE